jgi:hypothetical protein
MILEYRTEKTTRTDKPVAIHVQAGQVVCGLITVGTHEILLRDFPQYLPVEPGPRGVEESTRVGISHQAVGFEGFCRQVG